MPSLIRTPKEEGHYTIKRVDRLPPRGNMNWLYTFRTSTLDKFYRYTVDGEYEEIIVGGSGSSVTNTSQLVNDGASGVSTYVELNGISTVAISGDYNDLVNAPANVIESIVAGTNVTVDNTDPANPIVSATGGGGGIASVVGSTNIAVDNTDPNNPIVSALDLVTVDTTQTVSGQKTWTNLNTFNSSVDIRSGNLFVEDVYLTPHTPFAGTLTGRVDFGVDSTYRVYFHPEGGTSNAFLNFNGISADREYMFQDGSGTLAFLSDIPTSLASIVGGTNISVDNTDPNNPIVNAVDVVDTTSSQSVAGNKTFSGTLTAASFLQVNATNPAQNIFLLYPINTLGGTTLVGGAASYLITAPDGSMVWRGTNNPDMVFSNQNVTERRTYTLQDGDGTLAFLSDIPAASTPTGLEALDEGNGNGWRLIGKDPANYGNIGLDAVDLSENPSPSTTQGATGANSFAIGLLTTASNARSFAQGTNTLASGVASVAFGTNSQATNASSFAQGNGAVASGSESFAQGNSTVASGNFSFATGVANEASGDGESAVGRYGTTYTAADDDTDRVLNVGNGTGTGSRSDALTVLRGGEVIAPSLTNTIIDAAVGTVLVTKDWVNANASSPTGLEAIDEGNGIGWRLIGKNPAVSGNIGLDAVDFTTSASSPPFTGALGQNSGAGGRESSAFGDDSFVWGNFAVASGDASVAFGTNNTAGSPSNGNAIVTGTQSAATGASSAAFGNGVTAASFAQVSVGLFNTEPAANSSTAHNVLDLAFQVGIGTADGSRADGLQVFKGGEVIAPELDNATIDAAGGTVLITKDWANANLGGGGGGQVDSVVAGTNVTVDNTDPVNPIVNAVIPANFSGSSVTPVTTSGAGLTIGMDIAVPAGTLANDGDALEFFAIFDVPVGTQHSNLAVSCNLGISAATCNNFTASTATSQIVARGHVIRLNATTVRQYIVCGNESDVGFSEVNSNQSTVTDLDSTINQFRIFLSDSAATDTFEFITGRVTKQ